MSRSSAAGPGATSGQGPHATTWGAPTDAGGGFGSFQLPRPGAPTPPTSERFLERVPFRSLEGTTGIAILGLIGFAMFGRSLWLLSLWITHGGPVQDEYILDKDILRLNLLAELLFFGILPCIYLLVVRPGERVAQLLGIHFTSRTHLHVLVGVIAAFPAAALLGVAKEALEAATGVKEGASPLIQEIADLLRENSEFLLLLPLTAGIVEELFFRGFLQPRIGIWASSAVFALGHVSYFTVFQIVGTFLLGLVFGYLFKATRSLWTAIGAHVGFNFVQALFLYLNSDKAPLEPGEAVPALAWGLG